MKLCYHDNAIRNLRFDFDGIAIDVETLSIPVTNVTASNYHIVTIESSRCLSQLVSGPVTDLVIDAGHIGVVMGRKARGMFESVAEFHTNA